MCKRKEHQLSDLNTVEEPTEAPDLCGPFLRAGGRLSDSACAFSRDGLFLLVPRGREITVISSHSGVKVGAVKGLHSASIRATGRFDLEGDHEQYFASLDEASRICVWTWEARKRANDTAVPNFLGKQRAMLDLTAFKDFFMTHEPARPSNCLSTSIIAIHPYTGALKTVNSAGLIVLVQSTLATKVIHDDLPSASDSSTDENNDDSLTTRTLYEVFVIPLDQLLTVNPVATIKPKRLFVCEGSKRRARVSSVSNPLCAVSPDGSLVAVTCRCMLHIWNKETDSVVSTYHREPFSSVAFHPQSSYLATGDTSGRVTWWYLSSVFQHGTQKNPIAVPPVKNRQVKALHTKAIGIMTPSASTLQEITALSDTNSLEATEKKVAVELQIATQHWHSHRVQALGFTCDGLHLVSGGEEGVLVFWHVSQTERQFVPRLRAPVHTIMAAPEQPFVAACLADNSVAIVDVSKMKVSAVYQSVQLPLSLVPGASETASAIRIRKDDLLPVSIIPYSATHLTQALIVGSGITADGLGPNTGLQIYDLLSDRSLGSFAVNKQNFVCRDRARNYQWTIQQVALTSDTQHLATVEYRRSRILYHPDDLDVAYHRMGTVSKISDTSKDTVETRKRAKSADTNTARQPLLREFCDKEYQSGRHYVIKFWEVKLKPEGDGLKHVELVAEIDSPHTHDVTSFVRQDQKHGCDFLTASLDTTWKIWRRHHQPSLSSIESITTYLCIYTGSFRSLPCLSVAVSLDGSFTAVNHPGCVSVWKTSPAATGMQRSLFTSVAAPRRFDVSVPTARVSAVCWIESAAGTLGGERLLVTSLGAEVWIWDMRHLPAQLLWANDATGNIRAIMIPDPWGLPRFSILSIPTQTLEIVEVKRADDGTVNCESFHRIAVPKIRDTENGSQQPLLGFAFFGSPLEPCAAFLTGSLELLLYHLDITFVITPENSCFEKVENDGEVTTCTADEPISDDDSDADVASRVTTALEEPGATSFLASFAIDSQALYSKSFADPHQLEKIIGQSKDGLSHLAPPPSVILRNMLLACSPSR